MAEETTTSVESAKPARPKMRVKLMFSHPTNNRPKVKMAKVDGCTFFRKGDEWRHVDNSCKRTSHWTYSVQFQIGECTLIRQSGNWAHQGQPCASAKAYLETQDKANEAAKELIQIKEKFGQMQRPECLPDSTLVPQWVDNCKFVLVGDVFHHEGLRCKKHVHFEAGPSRALRMTRAPGEQVDEFVKAANEAIGQALAIVPPNLIQRATVEV